jgi:hypothetical protein
MALSPCLQRWQASQRAGVDGEAADCLAQRGGGSQAGGSSKHLSATPPWAPPSQLKKRRTAARHPTPSPDRLHSNPDRPRRRSSVSLCPRGGSFVAPSAPPSMSPCFPSKPTLQPARPALVAQPAHGAVRRGVGRAAVADAPRGSGADPPARRERCVAFGSKCGDTLCLCLSRVSTPSPLTCPAPQTPPSPPWRLDYPSPTPPRPSTAATRAACGRGAPRCPGGGARWCPSTAAAATYGGRRARTTAASATRA